MKTAIVTGAHGYIGSVLSKILSENKYYVIGIDDVPKGIKDTRRVSYCNQFYPYKFEFPVALEIIENYPEATIFHLAANSLLGPSAYDPLSYFENNTAATLKLLKNISHKNKIIFASTAAVYDVTDKAVKETDKISPPNNYGKSKLWCEEMMKSSYEILNLKIMAFRFFNVIGAYQDVGQELGTPHIISQLSDSAYNGKSFYINGNDYPTRDGTCVRDYLHVIDVCRALIHADLYLDNINRPFFEVYNLGTNQGTSVKEIVETFKRVVYNIEVKNRERRIGDPPFLVANPQKYIEETGFKYEFTEKDLDKMIETTWRYYNGI